MLGVDSPIEEVPTLRVKIAQRLFFDQADIIIDFGPTKMRLDATQSFCILDIVQLAY
jgi:hypothetical protein